jgi:Ser/Thr protein kinase RdoA (MazF antagonist)
MMHEDQALNSFLIKNYRLYPVSITPLGGYSNQNFHVTDEQEQQYVLRISRANRSVESLQAEKHILYSLEQAGFTLAPRLYSSPDDNIQLNARFTTLFRWRPGSIPCLWWQQCSIDQLEQIFAHLAALHQAMEGIPGLSASLSIPTLPPHPPEHLEATMTGQYVIRTWPLFYDSALRLQTDIIQQFPWHAAGWQWTHGDIQLENTLFEEQRFSAFLDFEQVSWGAREKDAIFSAFRVCKEGASDEPFQYDEYRLSRAIDTYRQSHPTLCASFFTEYDTYWKPYFCLDQAMLYITNAFDGIWQLREGIGFLPCYNEVLNYRHSK